MILSYEASLYLHVAMMGGGDGGNDKASALFAALHANHSPVAISLSAGQTIPAVIIYAFTSPYITCRRSAFPCIEGPTLGFSITRFFPHLTSPYVHSNYSLHALSCLHFSPIFPPQRPPTHCPWS